MSISPRYVTVTAAAGWCAPSYAGELAYERLASPPGAEYDVVSSAGELTPVRVLVNPPEPLEPPSWWTASGGNRYPAEVLEPDFPWPLPVPTVTDRRTWTPTREQRARWAEEDRWFRRQLALCVE